jgi:hypothetical protein
MIRQLLAWFAACLLAGGCAGVQPTLELREKPAHTCTGWRECFGQVWLGLRVPIADNKAQAQFICVDGKLVGIIVPVDIPAGFAITWSPTVCAEQQPQRRAAPSRST